MRTHGGPPGGSGTGRLHPPGPTDIPEAKRRRPTSQRCMGFDGTTQGRFRNPGKSPSAEPPKPSIAEHPFLS